MENRAAEKWGGLLLGEEKYNNSTVPKYGLLGKEKCRKGLLPKEKAENITS